MTLQELKDKMTVEQFNHIVMTYLTGDDDLIKESIPPTLEEYDPKYDSELYHKLGLCDENFPYYELEAYIERIREYFKSNLIIPIS